MRLSDNFSVEDFSTTNFAGHQQQNLKAAVPHRASLKVMADRFAERIHKQFGCCIITSGYRCPEVNDLAGGSPVSQHALGAAMDCEISGTGDTETLFQWCINNFDPEEFHQLIYEYNSVKKVAWVHISLPTGENDGQIFRLDQVLGTRVWISKRPTT
jgi:hypothetical protein